MKDKKKNENLDDKELDSNVEEHEEKVDDDNLKEMVEPNKKTSNTKKIISIIILLIIIVIGFIWTIKLDYKEASNKDSNKVDKKDYNTKYSITGNGLDDFDLYFMKEHNENTNSVYSPLSIKTALAMLSEGANGDTKGQIVSVIGDYKPKKYTNSENMSFANAMFINNNYKESIKKSYISNLEKNYGADVAYDSFDTPDIVNKWVDAKTFGQIKNMVDNISSYTFVQVNALAIDMEWVDKFQKKYNENKHYSVYFPHQSFSNYTNALDNDFDGVKFNDSYEAESGEFAGVINRYNIVDELGEDTIRKTITDEYTAWLKEDPCGTASTSPEVNTYVDTFIKELKDSYKHISSSTDYYLYNDNDVKAFAKDLKTYNDLTLQYVAIMPKSSTLNEFVSSQNSKNISEIINKLKDFKLENFNDKVITKINGNMPFFDYNTDLDLIADLKKIGVTDIFDIDKADLTGIVDGKNSLVIGKLIHKANIQLSNEGIKASAATMSGGLGSASCPFYDHIYEVPVEEIDMDFNKPFMYLIRDKKTGEVWFAGTVYEPNKYNSGY